MLTLAGWENAVADEEPTSRPAAKAAGEQKPDPTAAAEAPDATAADAKPEPATETPDPAAVARVKALVAALDEPDEAKRVKALLPLLQRSLLNEAGDDLDPFVRRYSFAKASAGVRFVARPVQVVQVRRGRPVTLGAGATAQRGRQDLYFVARPAGATGSPAPVGVFFPDDGGPPTIADFGSL